MRIINVSKEFAKVPGGRYRKDGPYSAQAFRETILEPALAHSNEVVIVDLEHSRGVLPCWVEEVFGGTVRQHGPHILERLKWQCPTKPELWLRIDARVRVAISQN